MALINFTVYGTPQGKGRPRVTRYGTYTPEKTRQYEKLVQFCWKRSGAVSIPDKPLCVTINAYFEPPKSLSKKKRAALIGERHTKKPDADNIAKAILDALNGLAFPDDSAVARLTVNKLYAEEARAEVSIMDVFELNGATCDGGL